MESGHKSNSNLTLSAESSASDDFHINVYMHVFALFENKGVFTVVVTEETTNQNSTIEPLKSAAFFAVPLF